MSIPVKLLWSLGEKRGIEESSESTAPIDCSDTLNWKMTPVLLAIFAVIIGSSQAFGEPISCQALPESKAYNQYISAICYMNGSYSVPPNMSLQEVADMRPADRYHIQKANPVEYYQWIPYLMTFQLIFFILPGLVWKWARKRMDLDLDTVLKRTQEILDTVEGGKVREEKMVDLVDYIFETLKSSPGKAGRDFHTFTLLFLSIKLVTLINVIHQFLFLVYIIGEGDALFGYNIMVAFLEGEMTSSYFPLRVLCDFFSARMGQIHDYTIECFLVLNFFHDKMFAILWAWYLFLMVYSMVAFLNFCFSLLPVERFIESIVSPSLYHSNKYHIRQFYSEVLFSDGITLLQFVTRLKGHQIALEITERLYAKYEEARARLAWIYPTSLKKKDQYKVIEEH